MKWTVAIVAACFFAAVLASCATNDTNVSPLAQGDVADLRALIQRQLMRCWTPPARLVNADRIATVRFKLNRGGSLADVPSVVKPATDPLSQAANESALRAVRQCTPLKLPADRYEVWKEVEVTFDPHTPCSGDDPQHCRPLAVDGSARTEFIRSSHDQCVKGVIDPFLTSSQIEFHCTCIGTTIADAITVVELANATSASMQWKGISVAPACLKKALARD